jgi:hypothetical protein
MGSPRNDGYQVHGVVTHVIDREGRWQANFHGLKFEPTNLVLYINALVNDPGRPHAHGPNEETLQQLLAKLERMQFEERVKAEVERRLAEREAQSAQQAEQQAEVDELEVVRKRGRLGLDAKAKSDLIDRLGRARYEQLPLYGEGEQPRDANGRSRSQNWR